MAFLRRLLGRSQVDPSTHLPAWSELLRRVHELEADRASLRLEIGALIARAEEILDTAERKRRRAAAAESKLRAREEPEGSGSEPLDIETYRERLRRGEIAR